MTTDMSIFTPALMDKLGLPVAEGRIGWCAKWAEGESTNALWNPFATTLPAPGWEDPSNPYFNTFPDPVKGPFHVRNYRDLPSGVAATAATIRQTELPGDFRLILQSLTQQRVLLGVGQLIRDTWGTFAFGTALIGGWTPTGWTSDYVTAPAAPVADPLDDLLIAVFAGAEQPGDRAAKLAYAQGRKAEILAGNAPSILEIAAAAKAAAKFPPHRHRTVSLSGPAEEITA